MPTEQKVKIFIGPGGVGKTSLSASYALNQSKNFPDKKFKLITIDPSKRLRDIFSMKGSAVEKEIFQNLNVSLNHRDQLMKSFLGSSLSENDLLDDFYKSKIFKSLLDDLSVAQEFTTFFELVTSYNKFYFDEIIIDTPPLQNTADFMSSLKKLESLFSSKLISLFFSGSNHEGLLKKMIYTSRTMSFSLLKSLTGSNFVNEIDLFFKVTELLRVKILDILDQSKSILSDNSVFYSVCNCTELSVKALNRSLVDLKNNKNLKFEKAFVNRYEEKQSQPIKNALAELRKGIDTEAILKSKSKLESLDAISTLLHNKF
jgi:anion-transporting  ArsA/GET3 family ATPase